MALIEPTMSEMTGHGVTGRHLFQLGLDPRTGGGQGRGRIAHLTWGLDETMVKRLAINRNA
jgi:hypothetical protein